MHDIAAHELCVSVVIPEFIGVTKHDLDQGYLCCSSSFLSANQQTELCREGAEMESEGLNADGSPATKMGAGPGLLGEMVPQTQTLAHEYKDGRGGGVKRPFGL